MMKMSELQAFLDAKFPNGALVTFSEGGDNLADFYRLVTPRLMVVSDEKIVFFSSGSHRDFSLFPTDVTEEGDFVILKGASPAKTDVSVKTPVEGDGGTERAARDRQEIFTDARLASMRDFT